MSGKAIKTWTSFQKPVYERVHVFQRGTWLSLRAVPKNSIQSSYACSDALGIWQRPWGKPQGVKGMDTPLPSFPVFSVRHIPLLCLLYLSAFLRIRLKNAVISVKVISAPTALPPVNPAQHFHALLVLCKALRHPL